MIQTCTRCGALHEAHAEVCCFSDAPLLPNTLARTLAKDSLASRNIAGGVDWRREVASRMAAYRARHPMHRDSSQVALPFPNGDGAGAGEPGENPVFFGAVGECGGPVRRTRPERVERLEITVRQPELDFDAVADRRSVARARNQAGGVAPLLRLAGLGERRRAGLLDALFVLLAFGGFLGLFSSLGGHISPGKLDAAVYGAALALLYAQYFALFTAFGGSTPGMLLLGLRVVSFDGERPTERQLLWRSFGYMVSGGTVLLGFLWALWDEDHLTWQDRISGTYLVLAEKQAIGARKSV